MFLPAISDHSMKSYILLALLSLGYMFAQQPNNPPYTVKLWPYSGGTQEFCAMPYNGSILFVTNRSRGFFLRPYNKESGRNFFDFYTAPMVYTATVKPTYLKSNLNSKYHDGPGSVSADGNTIYFTRSNYSKGKLRRSSEQVVHLSILVTKKDGETWSEPELMFFNSDDFSCGHPSLSTDGQWLFFSSDMPGGHGGSDIWAVQKSGDSWGKPFNLGPNVNSKDDELFPYIHPSGVLFFSSKGRGTKGGLDIFSSRFVNGGFENAVQLPEPINGPADDFGMFFNKGLPTGYFSSSRNGTDDIFQFERKPILKGTVVDAYTGEKLKDAEVVVLDVNGQKTTFKTTTTGTFEMPVTFGRDLQIEASKTDYQSSKMKINGIDFDVVSDKEVKIQLVRNLFLAGLVTDSVSGAPLSEVSVALYEADVPQTKNSNAEGKYSINLKTNTEYTVVYKRKGYLPVIRKFTSGDANHPVVMDVKMQPGKYLMIEGTTLRKSTGAMLPGVNVRANKDNMKDPVKKLVSNKAGKYWLVLTAGSHYTMFGSAPEFFVARYDLPSGSELWVDTTIVANLELVDYKENAIVQTIYYDYKKFEILQNYYDELNEIVYFMLDNPTAKVELGAHTDARGGDPFNMQLSKQRADAAVNYIISMGIFKDRILAIGYGESAPVVPCKDPKDLTEAQHQMNRRCEIKIIKIVPTPAPVETPSSN